VLAVDALQDTAAKNDAAFLAAESSQLLAGASISLCQVYQNTRMQRKDFELVNCIPLIMNQKDANTTKFGMVYEVVMSGT